MTHSYSDFLCYPRQSVIAYVYLLKRCVFVAEFCEEQVLFVVNINGIIKNFAYLKRGTGKVTLKVPFAEFVEVPMVIILGRSLGILADKVA